MTLITVPLAPFLKKAEFSCGKESLDTYIRTKAKQDVKNKLAQTFVLPDGDVIKGYYTLSAAGINRNVVTEDVLKKVGRYADLPVTLLGWLAVDKRFMGQRLGELLLIDALARSCLVADLVASFAVVVDPIDEEAASFYDKYGFTMLDSGRMFLPMKTIEPMVEFIVKDTDVKLGPK